MILRCCEATGSVTEATGIFSPYQSFINGTKVKLLIIVRDWLGRLKLLGTYHVDL